MSVTSPSGRSAGPSRPASRLVEIGGSSGNTLFSKAKEEMLRTLW